MTIHFGVDVSIVCDCNARKCTAGLYYVYNNNKGCSGVSDDDSNNIVAYNIVYDRRTTDCCGHNSLPDDGTLRTGTHPRGVHNDVVVECAGYGPGLIGCSSMQYRPWIFHTSGSPTGQNKYDDIPTRCIRRTSYYIAGPTEKLGRNVSRASVTLTVQPKTKKLPLEGNLMPAKHVESVRKADKDCRK